MGSPYSIRVPEEGTYQFDIAELRDQLQTRWQDAVFDFDEGKQDYAFALPPQPLGASPDPAAPGGLHWWPMLLGVPSEHGSGRRWQLASTVSGYLQSYWLSPDCRCFCVDGSIIDCVVFALWLRSWLPSEVPLITSINWDTRTTVTSGMTIVVCLKQMFADEALYGQSVYEWLVKKAVRSSDGWWYTADGSAYLDPRMPHQRDVPPPTPPEWADKLRIPPEEQPSEAVMRGLLFDLLGDEAQQFLPVCSDKTNE